MHCEGHALFCVILKKEITLSSKKYLTPLTSFGLRVLTLWTGFYYSNIIIIISNKYEIITIDNQSLKSLTGFWSKHQVFSKTQLT